jgi:FG-GAP-like repeat/Aldos-2-ulose dehydratase, beta-propeller domain/FG-GAP repeat
MKALALALAAAAIVSTQNGGGATGFTAHEIGTGLRGGYQVVVADLNKDGKPDIIAVAQGLPELLWYENPGWQRHVLLSGVSQPINASVYDIDGDGIPEIALAQGFTMSTETSKGQIGLLTHGPDVTAPWTYKEIDAVPTAHRIRWIDPDGSGRKILAMAPLIGPGSTPPEYRAPMSILFYRAPDWKRAVLSDAFTGLMHGIEPMPWDDGKGDVLVSASFMGLHRHRFANGKWTQTEITTGDPQPWPKSGASDVTLGRLGAQKFLATIEPWHGNEVVIYTESGGVWKRRVLYDKVTGGHEVAVVDLNGDGRDDVVANANNRVTEQNPNAAPGVHVFFAPADAASGEWTYRRIEDKAAMNSCVSADVNGDKKMDLVCTGAGGALRWYENKGASKSSSAGAR